MRQAGSSADDETASCRSNPSRSGDPNPDSSRNAHFDKEPGMTHENMNEEA
jgi:hypothetical protein